MRRRRTLSAEERSLWAHVVRDLVPLRGRAGLPAEEPRPPLPEAQAPAAPLLAAPAKSPRPVPALPPLAALDRKARGRIRRGVTAIDEVLDLHGLRQAEAHDRLVAFLHRGQSRGHSVVLVVTGKGAAAADGSGAFDERGVLRRLVPHWLRLPDLRPLVLGFEEAAPHHGGAGALYIRLRRRRGP